ncbi:hypothetical protein GCM10010170_047800 [Dactylosporangium salmoneum]|uniref:Uncharacterized protein n=1 Tax=Dactylosporangium salmoneum TaxID=53361 RepID=A0ABN3GM71_9ACTN
MSGTKLTGQSLQERFLTDAAKRTLRDRRGERGHGENGRHESGRCETDAANADTAKTDATKADAARTDAANADTAKTDATKADAARTDAANADTAKTDATKADAMKTDATNRTPKWAREIGTIPLSTRDRASEFSVKAQPGSVPGAHLSGRERGIEVDHSGTPSDAAYRVS